ncbi:MAG: hypothetical protein Fur0015_10660 [Ignavibacteriales bacterium]
MNTGQTIISVGALAILSLIVLRINTTFLSTNTILYESKFNITAMSLATSIVEEATSKAFDEKTDSNSVSSLSGLSSAIGKESGEVYPNFDDFDDFDGYTITTVGDSTFESAVFNIVAHVYYVDPSNPERKSSTPTWHKRIDVDVTSPSMMDTIQFSQVYSYWYFR